MVFFEKNKIQLLKTKYSFITVFFCNFTLYASTRSIGCGILVSRHTDLPQILFSNYNETFSADIYVITDARQRNPSSVGDSP